MTDPYTLDLMASHHSARGPHPLPWSVRLRLPWFRALPLACVEEVVLTVAGQIVATDDLLFLIDRHLVTLSALYDMSTRYWAVDETLAIGFRSGVTPPVGALVTVELVLRMPDRAVAPKDQSRRVMRASTRVSAANDGRQLGVCSFSLGAELRRGRSLQSCFAEVAAIDGYDAVELLGAQVVQGYPSPDPRWLDRFSGMLRATGLTPICYDAFADPGRLSDGTAHDGDIVRWAEQELEIASALGCDYVRLDLPARRLMLEAVAAAAQRRGIVVLGELHAQTIHDPEVVTRLELLDKIQSPQLALILDLSCVMQAIPAGYVRQMLELGIAPEIVQLVERGWSAGRSFPVVRDELLGRGVPAGDEAMRWARRAYRLFRRSDPGWLQDVVPFVRIVHGKFFAMEGGTEPAIAYDEVMAELAAAGFDGPVMSEFEGHLWDGAVRTFEQLSEHSRMMQEYSRV